MSPRTRELLTTLCPFPLPGVTDEQLGDVIDAWLADEFTSEAYRHIHDHEEGDQ